MSVEYELYALKWDELLSGLESAESAYEVLTETEIQNHVDLPDQSEDQLFYCGPEFIGAVEQFRKADDHPELERIHRMMLPMLWAFALDEGNHRIMEVDAPEEKLEMVEWAFSPERTQKMAEEFGALDEAALEQAVTGREFAGQLITDSGKFVAYVRTWKSILQMASAAGCGLLVYVYG